MPPMKRAKKAKKDKKTKRPPEDEASDDIQNDDEVFNTDNANQQAINDAQEDLTQEEKDLTWYKTLTSNNP